MYEEDQDVDDLDRLLVCPYDANHQVAATRMNHHLVKCRKNYFVNESEKTICPFNAEHTIFAQEIEYHNMVCPDKPEFGNDNVQDSDDKRPVDKSENVDVGLVEEAKPHINGKSDPRTDETGCINGLKVGGLKNYNTVHNDEEDSVVAGFENHEIAENREKKETHENGASGDEKFDYEDRSVNAVSHMAGIEPQDDNIAIEKQLSQSNGNIPSSGNSTLNENNVNDCVKEHFDYKKYAPSKEEKEEFLKLLKQRKDEQNILEDKDESSNQTYSVQTWQQNYTYITSPYQTSQPYHSPGMYNATFIAFPNGYHQVIGNLNGQSPFPTHYTFQPPNGHAPQYMPQPMQGVGYEYNMYSPRPQYRPNYRRRNYHHNNHSHNRHMHNGYHHNHNHYNGYNQSGNHGNRNHHSHYNGYYSNNHDAYSHTDTDSNSSASGHSDIGGAEHGTYNGTALPPETNRTTRNPRRTKSCTSSKGSVNLEKVIHIITDSDGECSLPSINGHTSDLSPEPSESCEISIVKKGEKERVIRKLKKKLNEIHILETKKNSGVTMDCDQLKKLNRRKELEDELAALTMD